MKKLMGFLMVCMFILVCIPVGSAKTIQVIVNDAGTAIKLDGKALNFSIGPVVKDGRMMVPFRDFAEQLGYQVQWDPQQKKVTIIGETITGEKQVVLWGGDNHAVIVEAGKEKDVILEVSPTIIQGRTMVPLRFVGEAMDCEVKYERTAPANVQQLQSLPSSGFLQAPYTVSNTLNNVTFPAGTPVEFVRIAEVVDIDDENFSGRALNGKVSFYQLEYYPEDKYFHMPITEFSEQYEREDMKKILKVFFPTEYEKAYAAVLGAWEAGCNDNFDYSKNSTFDGITFKCRLSQQCMAVDIGR